MQFTDLNIIILKCLKNGCTVYLALDSDSEDFVYEISGFSKSNVAKLKYDNGKIVAKTRYGQLDIINSWYDLVLLSYEWYRKGIDKGYSLPIEWKKEFSDYGLINDNS